MFHSARLKLTGWYLLIIMAISIAFSIFIYFGSTQEFDRILRTQRYRIEHPEVTLRIVRNNFLFEQNQLPPSIDPEVIQDAKIRVLLTLFGINSIILVLSALSGYFLAGRTLKPIKEMVDEQNRFITDSSHELNTPLTSLKTAIEVNLRNKKLDLTHAKQVLISNLEDVNSLQQLSDELIKLTQYQKINGNFQIKKVSLGEIIENAVSKVKHQANKKKIIIKTTVPKISIRGDSKSLTELLVILLDNAVKYSKNGKIITVNVLKNNSKVEIRVEDQGIGMKKEDLLHIFDRFYRADKSRTKQQVVGYGLGLSIAKRIVNLHQGTINVKSVLGEGTTFTILLPVA